MSCTAHLLLLLVQDAASQLSRKRRYRINMHMDRYRRREGEPDSPATAAEERPPPGRYRRCESAWEEEEERTHSISAIPIWGFHREKGRGETRYSINLKSPPSLFSFAKGEAAAGAKGKRENQLREKVGICLIKLTLGVFKLTLFFSKLREESVGEFPLFPRIQISTVSSTVTCKETRDLVPMSHRMPPNAKTRFPT